MRPLFDYKTNFFILKNSSNSFNIFTPLEKILPVYKIDI